MSLQQYNQGFWIADDTAARAFVTQFITAMTAAGLVRTSDTGQIDGTTVLRPSAVNQDRGYAMFRFNDSLQATAPVFIKINFITSATSAAFNNGSTSVVGNWANVFQYLVQVGTATDGAGNFTGFHYSAQRAFGFTAANASYANVTYSQYAGTIAAALSGAANRVMFWHGIDALPNTTQNSSGYAPSGGNSFPTDGTQAGGMFLVERSKDATGADTADGIIFMSLGGNQFNTSSGTQYNSTGDAFHQYIPFTRANPYANQWYWNFITSQNQARITTLFNNELGAFVHFPQENTRIHNPPVGLLAYVLGDYDWRGTTYPITMYGVTRQYRPLGDLCRHMTPNTPYHPYLRPMIIWE